MLMLLLMILLMLLMLCVLFHDCAQIKMSFMDGVHLNAAVHAEIPIGNNPIRIGDSKHTIRPADIAHALTCSASRYLKEDDNYLHWAIPAMVAKPQFLSNKKIIPLAIMARLDDGDRIRMHCARIVGAMLRHMVNETPQDGQQRRINHIVVQLCRAGHVSSPKTDIHCPIVSRKQPVRGLTSPLYSVNMHPNASQDSQQPLSQGRDGVEDEEDSRNATKQTTPPDRGNDQRQRQPTKPSASGCGNTDERAPHGQHGPRANVQTSQYQSMRSVPSQPYSAAQPNYDQNGAPPTTTKRYYF